MKKTWPVLIALVCSVTAAYPQAQYAVLRLGVVDHNYNDNEWAVYVYVDLFDANTNLVAPLSHENYTWYWNHCDGAGWQGPCCAGWLQRWDGHKYYNSHQCSSTPYTTFYVKVRVQLGSDIFETEPIRVPYEGIAASSFDDLWNHNATLDQKLESNQSIGYIGLLREDLDGFFLNYPAPFPMAFREGYDKTLRANQALSQTTPQQKYRVWNNFLDDVRNHRSFTITPTTSNLTAFFNQTQPTVMIKTDLLEAPGTTGGTITFHDPWYIDFQDGNNWRNRGMTEPRQFHTRSLVDQFAQGWQPDFTTTYPESPNHPYRGVFLNQPFTGQNPVHYSVGAPSTNYINGWESYFVNWTGDPNYVTYRTPSKDTTAVVFKLPGATAIAKYKAHLGSSLADATGSNSQRKLVAESYDSPVLADVYLCYSSSGEVWFTRSTDYGATWLQEFPVSNGTGGFGAPSIASTTGWTVDKDESDPVAQYVVYRKYTGSTYQVYLREKRGLSMQGWQNPIQMNTTTTSTNPRPVIARTNVDWWSGQWTPFLLAIWEGTGDIRQNWAPYREGRWWWQLQDDRIPGSGGMRNPSISCPTGIYDGNTDVYVTADDGKSVFLWRFDGAWQQPWIAVPASVAPTSYSSQVSTDIRDPDAHQVHTVW